MTAAERAERAADRAAREAILAPQRLAAAERCWVYWHTAGRAPVRCVVRPDHHDGPHDYGLPSSPERL